MGTKAGVGTSKHASPLRAGVQAAEAALAAANIDDPDLVIVYATVAYEQKALIRSIREATKGATLIGCSAEGTIGPRGSDEGVHSVLVGVVKSDELRFAAAHATDCTSAPGAASRDLGRRLKDHRADDSLALVTLADGLAFNFDPFIQGLEATLLQAGHLPVLGGLAGDSWQFAKTYQYHDDEVFSDAAVGLLVSGSAKFGCGISHGVVPVGQKRKITRWDANTIYEIDGIPALDLVAQYLEQDEVDDWTRAVVHLCLAFETPENIREDYEDRIIRYMPAKDEAQRAVSLQTRVPGTDVWIARRDHERMEEGIRRVVAKLRDQMAGASAKLVFHFDCAGRGSMIFSERQKQAFQESLRGSLGHDLPWMGLHTYGEIGPVRAGNYFHNYTAIVGVFY